MTEKRIDIKITDKIDPKILSKLDGFSKAANQAAIAEEKLAQARAKTTAETAKAANENIKSLITASKYRQEQDNSRIAEERLSQAQQRTAISTAKANSERLKSLITARKYSDAQTKSQIEEQRLSQAIQKTAVSESKANSERLKSLITARRYAQEQDRSRIVETKVEAERQKLAATTARTAAAQDRASITAIRLSKAQEQSSRAASRSVASHGSLVRTIAAYTGLGLGGREIIRTIDAYTLLENKLKVVTDGEEQLARVTQEVFDISARTYTGVGETATAFQRFDRAMKQLGASQSESLRLTETINKSLVVSGAATSEQGAALLQLSQAFNKGKLDGDEFRTVMELMPDVSDAIAKSLGVTRGELLKLAPEGVITAQVMRKAMAEAAEDIDAKFSKLTPTIGQAGVAFKNTFTKEIARASEAIGLSDALSTSIVYMSENMYKFGDAVNDTMTVVDRRFQSAIDTLENDWPRAMAFVANNTIDGYDIMSKAVRVYMENVFDALAFFPNRGIGLFAGFYRSVVSIWGNLPGSFEGIMASVVNTAAEGLEDLTNVFVDGFAAQINGIRRLIGQEEISFGKVTLPRLESDGGASLQKLLSDAKSEYVKGFSKDYIGDFFDDVAGEAANTALRRTGVKSAKMAANLVKTTLSAALSESQKILGDLGIEDTTAASKKGGGGSADSPERAISTNIKYIEEMAKLSNDEFIKAKLGGKEFARIYDERVTATRENIAAQQDLRAALDLGIISEQEYSDKLAELSTLKKNDSALNQQLAQSYQVVTAEYKQLTESVTALNQLWFAGAINAETYSQKLLDLRVDLAELRLEMNDAGFADGLLVALDKVRGSFENLSTSTANNMGRMFDTLSDGFADSIGKAIVYGDDLGDSLKNVAKTAMAELISATVRMGIQWAVSAAMQKAAMAQMSATSTAAAAQQTTAWAPAATTASIATIGGAAAIGVAAVIAAIAASKAFKDGGYTGDYGTDDIAGVVHGREYVMDAQTTQRIGVRNLEALQRGTANIQRSDNVVTNYNNVTNNNGGGGGEQRLIVVSDPSQTKRFFSTSEGRTYFLDMVAENRDSIQLVLGNG